MEHKEREKEIVLKRLARRSFFNGTHYQLDEEKRQLRLEGFFHKQLLEGKL